MSKTAPSRLLLTLRKLLVSAVVIVAFTIYALQHRPADLPLPLPTSTALRGITSSRVVSEPNAPTPVIASGQTYADGTFVGREADAIYGLVQVEAIVQGGKITDVQFLDYPHDRRTSIMINQRAMPYLAREAVQAQSGHVDVISGATLTSEAFSVSLTDALLQAKPS